MASARLIIEQLCGCGITDVVTLPDNASKALLAGLAARADIRVVGVTREGEAWAVASGLWIGGRTPAVLIQNTGFLESGDALRGTAMRMRIPLLCLLTYRGYATLPATKERLASAPVDGRMLSRPEIDSCALLFEPTLQAWGMPYDFLHDDADVAKIPLTVEVARLCGHPAALLISRDTT
ncbi:MAG: thiamine pyrophosphate-binding protein [Opitutaceae bacterium]|nr:thiamine pyrophosphate-binding protein [Opitutaceae bacterium]